MATETLSFNIFADDRASETFRRLGIAAGNASGDVKQLGDRLDKLGTRVTDARLELKGNKEASAELDKLDIKLIRLGNKVASPDITVEGKIKALADIGAVDLAMDRLNKKFSGGSGLFRLLGSLGGGGGGVGGLLGTGGGALAAGAGSAAIIGPLLVGLSQVVGALAAAGAGVTAFGALSIPQFTAISGALTQINTDTNAYERATTKASKATALKRIQQDWADISPPQRQAVKGIQSLGAEFTKLSNKLAPITFRVFNEGLKVANVLLPTMLPFARAAGNAIDGLLKGFERFAKSPAFAAWQAQLLKLTGPAVTALGVGLGKIAVALGKLILVSASPNSIRTLSRVLGFLAATIDAVSWAINRMSGNMQKWVDIAHQTASKFDEFRHDAAALFDTIGDRSNRDRLFQRRWANDVASAFDTVRHTLAAAGHDIAGAFDAVRSTFAGVGHSIASTFDAVRHAQGQFDAFGKDIAFVRHVITDAFDAIRHGGAVAFDGLRHVIATAWDHILHDGAAALGDFRHVIANAFDNIRHDIAAAWDGIWHHSNTQASSGIDGIVHWFKTLPGRALAAMVGLGHQLYAFGRSALNDFLSGMRSISNAILGWIGHFISSIWDKVKRFFGQSPPHPGSKFYDLGAGMMLHLEAGIKSHAHRAAAAATAVSHRVAAAGSGVQRWAATVRQALAMEGLSPSLLGNVLFQMQTESSGNPNAINLTDINAQLGDPSRGLMQVIGSTFAQWHWPGTSNNIYNPLANIAAALNYARHIYGPSLMSGGLGIGSGHGYAAGSWNVPHTGAALIHQGEMVIPARTAAAIRGGAGGNITVHVHVSPLANPAETGRQVATALAAFKKNGGMIYRPGGF